MTPPRLLSICLWAIIALLIVPLYFHIAWDDPVDYYRGGMGGRDFKAYYIAARLLERGEDIYDPSLQQKEMRVLGLPEDDTLYIYPTIFALITTPLSFLSLSDAARVWNFINIILAVGSLVLIARMLDLDHHLGRHFPWFIILFSVSYPTVLSLRAGQANFLLLFFLAFTLYAEIHGRQELAGITLTVPTLTKIFAVGFVLWFWWTKQYRAMIGFVIAATGILIASNLILFLTNRGSTSDMEYFARVLPGVAATTSSVNTQSLQAIHSADASVVWIVLGNHSVSGFFSRLPLSPIVSWLLTILCSSAIFLLTFRVPPTARGIGAELGFGGMLAMLLLISSLTWESALVLLLIPFSTLLKVWVLRNRPRRLTIVLIVALLLLNAGRLWAVFDSTILLNAPWLISLPFLGVILVWAACVNQSRIVNVEQA